MRNALKLLEPGMEIKRWFGLAVAIFVALVLGGRRVGADCPPEKDPPRVLFVDRALGRFDPSTARLFADHFFPILQHGAPGVDWTHLRSLQALASIQTTRAPEKPSGMP